MVKGRWCSHAQGGFTVMKSYVEPACAELEDAANLDYRQRPRVSNFLNSEGVPKANRLIFSYYLEDFCYYLDLCASPQIIGLTPKLSFGSVFLSRKDVYEQGKAIFHANATIVCGATLVTNSHLITSRECLVRHLKQNNGAYSVTMMYNDTKINVEFFAYSYSHELALVQLVEDVSDLNILGALCIYLNRCDQQAFVFHNQLPYFTTFYFA
uniref:Peptidase S1 domain-containing protein n=1 Tax=Ditylenchus dipsaci TaxID=166011 RepID=A0A915E0R7_9BILA